MQLRPPRAWRRRQHARRGEPLLKHGHDAGAIAAKHRVHVEPKTGKNFAPAMAGGGQRNSLKATIAQGNQSMAESKTRHTRYSRTPFRWYRAELLVEIVTFTAGGDFSHQFRRAGDVLVFIPGLTATIGQDAEHEIGLRLIFPVQANRAVVAGIGAGRCIPIGPKPGRQHSVRAGMILVRNRRRHIHDPLDKFGFS